MLAKRIGMGVRELEQMVKRPPQEPPVSQLIRRSGAGRKKLTEIDEALVEDLEAIIAPEIRGDPESLLRWTTKSVWKLADQLGDMGHQIGRHTAPKVSDEAFAAVKLKPSRFHGEWNYAIG